MQLLALQVMQEHFGLEFWSHAFVAYRREADKLLRKLGERYNWARGWSMSANEMDEREDKLYNWIVNTLKN